MLESLPDEHHVLVATVSTVDYNKNLCISQLCKARWIPALCVCVLCVCKINLFQSYGEQGEVLCRAANCVHFTFEGKMLLKTYCLSLNNKSSKALGLTLISEIKQNLFRQRMFKCFYCSFQEVQYWTAVRLNCLESQVCLHKLELRSGALPWKQDRCSICKGEDSTSFTQTFLLISFLKLMKLSWIF